ncbi:hypothetical protein EVAR_25767_1 [Eumeta japonica]|uniref:Uncharacterized protein n=1 Tax=Eumeta variegata TaxID=151549 RepID=A0A4C2A590_EUMVA|nr:hypothetical protein EVAR_25767_1 [Eumeta japonica]
MEHDTTHLQRVRPTSAVCRRTAGAALARFLITITSLRHSAGRSPGDVCQAFGVTSAGRRGNSVRVGACSATTQSTHQYLRENQPRNKQIFYHPPADVYTLAIPLLQTEKPKAPILAQWGLEAADDRLRRFSETGSGAAFVLLLCCFFDMSM